VRRHGHEGATNMRGGSDGWRGGGEARPQGALVGRKRKRGDRSILGAFLLDGIDVSWMGTMAQREDTGECT
jgi:hypothetical protein